MTEAERNAEKRYPTVKKVKGGWNDINKVAEENRYRRALREAYIEGFNNGFSVGKSNSAWSNCDFKDLNTIM